MYESVFANEYMYSCLFCISARASKMFVGSVLRASEIVFVCSVLCYSKIMFVDSVLRPVKASCDGSQDILTMTGNAYSCTTGTIPPEDRVFRWDF